MTVNIDLLTPSIPPKLNFFQPHFESFASGWTEIGCVCYTYAIHTRK